MSSRRQIVGSTALIGVTQLVNMGIGIGRTKVLAVMLGPSGVGLAELYVSTIGLISTVSGFGFAASGVRQIAEAAGEGRAERVYGLAVSLRRISVISGVAGALIVAALAPVLSYSAFGDKAHANAIAALSLTVFFGSITAGWNALLQGLRKLRCLAIAQTIGNASGAALAILCVWWLERKGIVPYILAISISALGAFWWFARDAMPDVPADSKVSWRETLQHAGEMISVGLALSLAALIAAGGVYATRVLIQRSLGLQVAGVYAATWTLSSYYVSVILTAMAADFMPRISAANKDPARLNALVNEQIEVGVIISLPGVVFSLAAAPWILGIFYSNDFSQGSDLMKWQVMSAFLRVVSWPLGYLLIARGKSILYVITELVYAVIGIVTLLACTRLWGIEGIGVAVFVLYVCVTVIVSVAARFVTGFYWSRVTLNTALSSTAVIAVSFLSARMLPEPVGSLVCLTLAVATAISAFYAIKKILGANPMTILLEKIRHQLPRGDTVK